MFATQRNSQRIQPSGRQRHENLQELQQEVKVNIIFLLPHVGSWNREASGALRVEPLIARLMLESPSPCVGRQTETPGQICAIEALRSEKRAYSGTWRWSCVWGGAVTVLPGSASAALNSAEERMLEAERQTFFR